MKEINEDYKFNGQLKTETDAGQEVNVNRGVRPYKVYTALLTQTGTNAPVATVLENTIGNIVWTRDDVGQYTGTLNGAFTVNKTTVSKDIQEVSGDAKYAKAFSGSVDTIILQTFDNPVDATDTDLDGIIFIEIRVYP